jgi:hypothetical protein
MASAAKNMRSMCGCDRVPPECSSQRSVADTPHVGQATEDICAGVRVFSCMRLSCRKISSETAPFGTLSPESPAQSGLFPLGLSIALSVVVGSCRFSYPLNVDCGESALSSLTVLARFRVAERAADACGANGEGLRNCTFHRRISMLASYCTMPCRRSVRCST